MTPSEGSQKLVEPLAAYVQNMLNDEQPGERDDRLSTAADYIKRRIAGGKTAELMFICTHNSRRSHFGQIWADTAARYYGLNVGSYSGGVEVTACNERTVRALRRAGFSVVLDSQDGRNHDPTNPVYWVQNAEAGSPVTLYSKLYSDGNRNVKEFAAMMCCSDVDDKCPLVVGAEVRIPLHYDDPKSADDTPDESARYDARCLQIGRDMFRLMKWVTE